MHVHARNTRRGLAGLGATMTACPACELCRRNGGTWDGSRCVYGSTATKSASGALRIGTSPAPAPAPVTTAPPKPSPAPITFSPDAVQRAIQEAQAYAKLRAGEQTGSAIDSGAPAVTARSSGPPSAQFYAGGAVQTENFGMDVDTGSLLNSGNAVSTSEKKESLVIPWALLLTLGLALFGKGA